MGVETLASTALPPQPAAGKRDGSEASPAAAAGPSVRWVTGEAHRRLLRDFTGERTGFVRVSDKGYFLPSKFATEMQHFIDFQPRATDTWIVTYPRSGTTWTQEMVWLLANDLDFETAKNINLNERFPFFEFNCFFHEDTKREFLEENAGSPEMQKEILDMAVPMYRALADVAGPRFIKTHLPFTLLPKNLLTSGAKVIYLARNPKDVAVSFFHLNRLIRTQGYNGDFETYWNYFQNDLHAWTPYWSHLEEGWQRRSHPRVLFMFYEEMSRDTPAAIRRVASFLEKSPSDEQVARLADHLDIVNFRRNPSVNSERLFELGIMRREEEGFIRKGGIGGWTNYFSPELEAQADRWIAENLSKTDMRFPTFSS